MQYGTASPTASTARECGQCSLLAETTSRSALTGHLLSPPQVREKPIRPNYNLGRMCFPVDVPSGTPTARYTFQCQLNGKLPDC